MPTTAGQRGKEPRTAWWVVTILGCILMAIGQLGLIVDAFKSHVAWGLAVWFIPGFNLIFALSHWQESKTAVYIALVGIGILGSGWFLR